MTGQLRRTHMPGQRPSWMIDGTPLTLTQFAGRWQVRAESRTGVRWLYAQQLRDARFATRRDALRTVQAALAVAPLRAPFAAMSLRSTGGGMYRSACRTVSVRYEGRGTWRLLDCPAGWSASTKMCAPTVTALGWLIAKQLAHQQAVQRGDERTQRLIS